MQLIHKWPDQIEGTGGAVRKGNLIICEAFRVSLLVDLKKLNTSIAKGQEAE